MITVHASTITAVPTNNGLGAILPSSCVVTQEINGEYELKLIHPKDEYGKWERLENDNILYVPTPDGTQLFRIYRVRKNIDGDIEVNARHIFYDLLGNLVESLTLVADAGEAAIDAILAATQYATTFTGSSDIATTQNATYIRKNPVQILISDDDNSFVNRWGGEISRNNFSIAMNTSIGSASGRVISYKKNLTGVDCQEEYSNVVTRIMPTGLNTDDTVLYLDPSKYVDSAHIADYPHPRIKHVHFTDVKVGREVDGAVPYATIAAGRAELTARAAALYALGCDLPETSIDVQFRELGDTEEYQQYIQLSTIQLGDTVSVKHDNTDLSLRVISYEWDALRGRHNKIRLGDQRPNIGQSVIDADIDISILKTDYSNAVKQNETYNAVYINHSEGFVAEATVGGKAIKTTVNATDGMAITSDTTKVFGVTPDGSCGVVRLTHPTDDSAYLQMGDVAGEAGRIAATLFQATGGAYTTPRRRLIFKSYGITATQIQGIPNTSTGDVEGQSILSFSHGDAVINLSDSTKFGVANITLGLNVLGVNATGFYKSTDGGTTKTYF